jgi:hypothetical protein
MAHTTGCRRDLEEIAAIVPMTRDSELAARLLIGAFLGGIAGSASLIWHISHTSSAVTFGILSIAVLVFVMQINVRRLLWLVSELLEQTRQLSYALPDTSERFTRAQYIEERDFISPIAESSDAHTGEVYAQPRSAYIAVGAVLKRQSGRVAVGFLGYEAPEQLDPDEQYLRRHGTLKPSSVVRQKPVLTENAAKAMADLITLLSSSEVRREDLVVHKLVHIYKNSPLSVRHAIQVGRSVHFISRGRKLSYPIEFLKVLSRRPVAGGHRSCEIELTDLGQLWHDCGSLTSENPLGNPVTIGKVGLLHMGSVNSGDTYNNFGAAGAVGSKNVVKDSTVRQTNQGGQVLDMIILAQELARLRAALREQATEPEHDAAIGDLASAEIAARKSDENATLTHLARLGSLGKWVLGVAQSIGTPLAISVIRQALKLPK